MCGSHKPTPSLPPGPTRHGDWQSTQLSRAEPEEPWTRPASLRHPGRRYRDGGAPAIADRRRGRHSNNRLPDAVRDHAVDLVRKLYPDFGPTLAAEKLAERHNLRISRETLRNWMRRAGIWVSRAEHLRFQQPRHRREHVGELVQIDGSEHRWFEDRAPSCTLLVFVDDATSRLMELRFVASESTLAYFEALKTYLVRHGKPVAFYSDKHSIFRVSNENVVSGNGMTQFGRALSELNIEILCANTSQAKGRVECAHHTLHDRLVRSCGSPASAQSMRPTISSPAL